MLTWYENIYVGNNAKKKEYKIRKKLELGKLVNGYYLITLPVNPQNNLEIIHAIYLKQRYLHENCPMIVGLAKGYDEAVELVQQMTEDALRETGTADIQAFFLNR